nr:PucR family transcriptional regulator [uncultured Eisenbergiella sp.]
MAIRLWEMYEETKEKYKLRILAGKNGMDNVTGWVHMLEDETIINRFAGEELAVTTGMKAGKEGWLLQLVSSMKQAESTGIIINTGMYLKQVPQDVIDWCETHNFPLLEMPWEISITDLIQDYCMRIMRQIHKERQEGLLFERLLRGKEVPEGFLEEIGSRYHLEGSFRIFCLLPKYTAEEKVLFRQAGLKLENVFGLWQNGTKIRFPYFFMEVKDTYILAVNDFPEEKVDELTVQIRNIFSYFFDRKQLSLGIGPACQGIHSLKQALGRARIAMHMSRQMEKPIVDFNQMGVFGILFSTEDPDILKSYAKQLLGPLEEYDRLHHTEGQEGTGYVETFRSYIANDRSLIGVARATYTHRNTVNYRIQNIKKLLHNELKTTADLFPYQIAFCIRDMKL